ncbi:glycosyl transferase family 2 [Lachnotalea glycerini]|uniref:Glycosyl transferase family 2 n=1 Tax=Lachnotalea glycerini TaxID=1763509 RepID=A0A318ENQ7_9FIRM|nr:glycosyltransferase family 2 protein [Lachnotalea glycerini]PXV90160.1 glycosyl transferase family 2 [Lachnotalea glycerini]
MISIIVPVYNSEKTLQRCLESLIHQTYSELEILLVIDGPTDTSIDIGKEYEKKDSRVKVILKENEGVSRARNTGIQHAKGEYIQFVDSDDYISEDMCETLLRNVENTGAQMAVCGYHHLFLQRDIVKAAKRNHIILKESSEEFLKLYEAGFLNMPWNKLFLRELIKNRFDASLSLGEDLLFNLEYMKGVESIVILDEPLYYYIQKNGQDTLSSKKRADKYQIAVRICEAVKEFYSLLLKEADKEEYNRKIQVGNHIIYKRLLLEFLDEIEGMAYDKTITRDQKLDLIEKYMKDSYIQNANQNIEGLQIDYRLINFFFKRKRKYIVYLLIYIRKWCLNLLRGTKS